MDVSWAEALAAVSAFASLVATVIALLISRSAAETARQSARAAAALVELETARWHHDMTPSFHVTVTALGPGTDQASLVVTFEGPPALERLDQVEVTIRDDGYSHSAGLVGGPTGEELADQIWGPYRFRPHVDNSSPDGRSVPPVSMDLGAWRKLLLERTLPPQWTAPGLWRQQYADAPVRLWVRCVRDGHHPWLLTYDVPVTDPSAQEASEPGS